METKLNTNQLGNNETVFTESSLVSGDNVLIQKHINPNVITEDTVYLWHFDQDNHDVISNTEYPIPQYTQPYNTVDFKFGDASWQVGFTRWAGYPERQVPLSENTFTINKDFTIDFWTRAYISNSHGNDIPVSCGFALNSSGSGFLNTTTFKSDGSVVLSCSGSSESVTLEAGTITANSWVHIAVEYVGSTHTMYTYLNGIKQFSAVIDTTAYSQPFTRFIFVGNLDDRWFRLDELRVSKCVVWDTTNDRFNVPTEAYVEPGSTPDYFELKTSGLVKETDLTAFTGTDGTAAGAAGLVPAPATTDAGKYLKADGTWNTPAGGTDLTTITNYKAGIPQQLINTENGLMWGSKERWYSNFKNGNKLEIYFNCPSSNPTTADIIWQVTTQQHTATEGKGAQNMLTMDTTSNPKSILYGDATDGALIGYFDSSTITYFTNSIGATDSTRWLRIHRENGDNVLYALNDDNYSIDALPELTSWELQGTLSGASIISGFGFSTNSAWGFKGTLKNLVIIFDDEKLFDLRYGNNVYDNASGGWNSHIIVEEKWV